MSLRNVSSGGPARIGEPRDLSRRHDVVIMIFGSGGGSPIRAGRLTGTAADGVYVKT